MALMRNIVVVPYDTNWPDQFAEESKRIANLFSSGLVDIQHIGSTSVPNLCAKPILDILLIVEDIQSLDQMSSKSRFQNPIESTQRPGEMEQPKGFATCNKMSTLGYEAKGELGIPGRRFFSKGADHARTHHLHAFEPNHPAAAKHIAFRDYLIAPDYSISKLSTKK